MLESSGRVFMNLLVSSIKSHDPKVADLTVILSEIVDYRLPNISLLSNSSTHHCLTSKASLLSAAFESMSRDFSTAVYSQGSQALTLYGVMERIIMRQIMVAPPVDFLLLTIMIHSSPQRRPT